MGPGRGLRGSANTPPLTQSAMLSRAGIGKKEDLAPSKDLLYLWYFPFSPICNLCFPLVYKREGRAPHQRDRRRTEKLNTHMILHTRLSSDQALGDLFNHSIRDLGLVPLSTVCTPYYEPFSVLITQAAANWTYGRSAQTSINLVSFSAPSGPNAQQL